MKEKEKKSENQSIKTPTPDTAKRKGAEGVASTDTVSAREGAEGLSGSDKVTGGATAGRRAEPIPEPTPESAPELAKEPCADCAQWQDKYVRLSAEFDNFRKRTLKEKLELIASGGEAAWKAILPVADDFERAIRAMSEREGTSAADLEGVRLIFQKLQEAMRSQGVTPIQALGEKMNVDFFDAVAKVPTPEAEQKGVVMEVVQTGYMLSEKVLRFAKVIVGE